MRLELKPVDRTCGSCTLCCKVMGIEDPALKKPKDQWCQHAKKSAGCGIYETRPDICRTFKCEWLAGNVEGAALRPDRIHGLVTRTTDGKNWVVHEDPGYEGIARKALKPAIDGWLKKSFSNYIIVVCGTKRVFFGKMAIFEALRRAGATEVADIKNVKVFNEGVDSLPAVR